MVAQLKALPWRQGLAARPLGPNFNHGPIELRYLMYPVQYDLYIDIKRTYEVTLLHEYAIIYGVRSFSSLMHIHDHLISS